MRRKLVALAGLCAVVLAVGLIAKAADEPANVAGTWQMSMQGRQGQ